MIALCYVKMVALGKLGEGNMRTPCTILTTFWVNLKLFQVLKNEKKNVACYTVGNGIIYAAFK